MGGQDSKPKDEDFFLLEHLSKMTMTNRRTVSYYLIHPRKDAAVEAILKELRTYFKVDHFPQIKTFKQEMAFVNKHEIVKVIASGELAQQDFEYLHNEGKIYQIIQLGKNEKHASFKKVIATVENDSKLLTTLNELEGKDNLSNPPSNILLVDEDTKMLNKYRLNYHCNTNYVGRSQAKEDLITLAKQLFPQQSQEIQKFAKEYNLELEGAQKNKLVLEWAFKSSFFWDLTSQITRNTTDPKRLAYVRLALKDIFQAIKDEFKTSKVYEEIYVVIDVTEEEKQKLENAKGHYILFTSFIKGYTNLKKANAQLKSRPNAFRFSIIPNRGQLEPTLDFGYVVTKREQPNAIYNIYNVFRVDEINIKTRRGEILYGALPQSYIRRQRKMTERYPDFQSYLRRVRLTKMELDLMRNNDYFEDMLVKVDSQASILQLSGYNKESLDIYDKKLDQIRKTRDSNERLDRCIIRKAEALRISGDFQASEKEYQAIPTKSDKMNLISQIHLAELYMQRGQQEKFDKVIDEIAAKLDSLKDIDKDEYFKARNFIAIRTIKKGSFKNAQKMLNQLQTEVINSYPYNYQGKPLVHDIYRSRAICMSKLGLHDEALELLKDTLSWQLVCEGKTANVALTETLIQSVSRTSGNNTELEESKARLVAISQEIKSSESRFGYAVVSGLNNLSSASIFQHIIPS